jgi:hypothetical protein
LLIPILVVSYDNLVIFPPFVSGTIIPCLLCVPESKTSFIYSVEVLRDMIWLWGIVTVRPRDSCSLLQVIGNFPFSS